MAEDRRKILESEVVRDKNGIRRFHGAFTGGFSAGYFNTVGTEEGWTPSEFISSKNKKGEVKQYKPQDFMDEDDDPLLSGKLKTKKEYDTFNNREQPVIVEEKNNVFSGTIPKEFLVPSSNAIGKQLLKTMGWREGQGVGPRLTAEEKGYGDIEEAKNQTFAPENTQTAQIKMKNDLYGIGYVPNIRSAIRSERSQHLKMGDVLKGDFSTAESFGLGALEEDDDYNIYGNEGLANYDVEITEKPKEKLKTKTTNSRLTFNNEGYVIEGFIKSTKKNHRPHRYIPEKAPSNFYGKHKFSGPLILPKITYREDTKEEEKKSLIPFCPVNLPNFNIKFTSEKDIKNNGKVDEIEIHEIIRIESEWRPDNILCKRFNIPNPFRGVLDARSDINIEDILNVNVGDIDPNINLLELIENTNPIANDPLMSTDFRPSLDLLKEIFS